MQNSTRTNRESVVQQAEEAVRRCEGEIQRLLADAASSGLYDETSRMTEVARALDEVASSLRPGRSAHADRLALIPRRQRVPQKGSSTRRKGYPRFLRDGNHLVKIGWSKKNREEYLHRAGFDHVGAVVERLTAAEGARPIPVDDILSVRDVDDNEIPGYQVYLVLAWLRQEGLVTRIGRTGYSVLEAESLKAKVSDRRSTLPEFGAS